MQGIYTHIPETNYVPREHGVAAILLFLFRLAPDFQEGVYCVRETLQRVGLTCLQLEVLKVLTQFGCDDATICTRPEHANL